MEKRRRVVLSVALAILVSLNQVHAAVSLEQIQGVQSTNQIALYRGRVFGQRSLLFRGRESVDRVSFTVQNVQTNLCILSSGTILQCNRRQFVGQ